MKIFTSSDISEIERLSVEREGITSYEQMERAASAIAYEIIQRWTTSQRIIIFAGPGNNGGDALAVARLLLDQGYHPIVLLFNTQNKLSHNCELNKKKLEEYDGVDFTEVIRSLNMPEITEDDVVIDGLFGSGLNEKLLGGYTSLSRQINDSGAYVVSIDIPSGLFGEYNTDNILRNVIHANLTLAIHFPRFSFFFEETAKCVGEWKVLDIGLDHEAIAQAPASYFLIDEQGVRETLKKRNPFTTKDDYGRACIVAGSLGMMGAAVLATRAAMRSGLGVAKLYIPQCGYLVAQTSVPEALCELDAETTCISQIPDAKNYMMAIGPGIGRDDKTTDALEVYLRKARRPVVLDADALNCIAERRSMLNDIPRDSVITPHAKEFDRLFGDHMTDEDRLLKAIEIAQGAKIVIVLKGHYTKIVRPDGKVFVNATGNPGMATAGSGDVLTGVITALMAQGLHSSVAASIGCFVHGYAGNLARRKVGEMGLTASDIVDNLGEAFKLIMEEK